MLAVVNLLLLLWLLFRPTPETGQPKLLAGLGVLMTANERLERELRTEVKTSARDTRGELTQGLSLFQQALLAQSGDVARTQNEQIDSFRVQLAAMQQQVAQALHAATQSLAQQAQAGSESVAASLTQARQAQASGLTQAREARKCLSNN